MKKSLKLVAIFMAVVIVVIVGGMSIYFLVENNKTYHIYDLRIVEPIESAGYFVYTDSEQNYVSFKNIDVYMTADAENRFEIAVYAYTSNESTNVSVSSSDTSVANVYSSGGRLFVHYYHAGTANITASLGGVEDSFKVTVYDKVVDNFAVFDSMHYGDFAQKYPNQLYAYSDEGEATESSEYSYSYTATALSNDGNEHLVDSELLRIARVEDTIITDQTDLNDLKGNIVGASIDTENKKLNLKIKSGLESDQQAIVVIQSYYRTADGEIKAKEGGSTTVYVNIVANKPQYLQIELGSTNNFLERAVYMNTKNDIDGENASGDELEEYLSNITAVNYLQNNDEGVVYHPVYMVYFNREVNHFYLKFRAVYTNGYVQELNPSTKAILDHSITSSSSESIESSGLKIQEGYDYYEVTLTPSGTFDGSGTYTITLTLEGGNELSFDFIFTYQEIENSPTTFYNFDPETRTFEYSYWDSRMRHRNVVTNEEGKITELVGIDMSEFAGYEQTPEPVSLPRATPVKKEGFGQ